MALQASPPVRIADRLWRLRGGFPVRMINVFLIEEADGGVTVFDAGISAMAGAIEEAAQRLGGLRRVVLGNSHADHRGAAPALDAPVYCHAAERVDAEGDGGAHYFDYGRLGFPPARLLTRATMRSWDGGSVVIAGTLAEGEEVAGFEVIELPGHSPGCLGLWRESDRLALSNDCFAMFDPQTTRPKSPRVPHPAFNFSTERARESMRKLAQLRPATCWPGHYGPLDGDVAGRLERALERS